jgi:hypothetical protein
LEQQDEESVKEELVDDAEKGEEQMLSVTKIEVDHENQEETKFEERT